MKSNLHIIVLQMTGYVLTAKEEALLIKAYREDTFNRANTELGYMMTITADEFGVSEEAMCNGTRNRAVTDARHTFCYLSRRRTKYSTTEIGRAINRDHASVLHACKKIAGILTYDKSMREMVKRVEDRL